MVAMVVVVEAVAGAADRQKVQQEASEVVEELEEEAMVEVSPVGVAELVVAAKVAVALEEAEQAAVV